jgi:hypothetical protein
MNRMVRVLGPAVGLFVAVSSDLAFAQADHAAPALMAWDDLTWPSGTPALGDSLPPAEIFAAVRREGFYPVGRPARRGRVYVLFAVDQDDMEVKLTVDAVSGRVLWVTGAAARFGGPGSYGYRPAWREQTPAQTDAPAPEPAAAGSSTGSRRAVLKHVPPLPRRRPANLTVTPEAPEEPPVIAPPAPLD